MEKRMNYYEILYIVNPNQNKDKISSIIEEINDFILSNKENVIKHEFWAKKQLAYNVAKNKYGNYVLLHCELSNPSFINEIKNFLNLNKEVLKSLIVKLEEKPNFENKREDESEKGEE
jgi:small subunit ribosomal protein S6